jgi:hypothetical protein
MVKLLEKEGGQKESVKSKCNISPGVDKKHRRGIGGKILFTNQIVDPRYLPRKGRRQRIEKGEPSALKQYLTVTLSET